MRNLPTLVRLRKRAAVLGCAIGMMLPIAPAAASGNDAGATDQHAGTELVLRALSLLGVNYRMGGNSPDTGLDCSGLVRHVFHEALGLVLPRRAEEMSRAGESIDPSQLRPGDLVFFNTLRRTFSHVGIYIGNNQFVHAPSSGGEVRVESMGKDYWVNRFNGARRLLSIVPSAIARPFATNPNPGLAVAGAQTSVGPEALPAYATTPTPGVR